MPLPARIKNRIRGYFIAGVVAVVPISITVYVFGVLLINGDRILDWLPARFNPKHLVPFPTPGLGALLVLLGILVVGILVKNYIGGRIVDAGEQLLCQIPLVRSIYTAVKQLLMAIFSRSDDTFKRVVLVEYPRKGIYALAFVTGVPGGEVQRVTENRMLSVFLPTTPNPTSGFYLLVPEAEAIALQMSVEEAFKLLISGGLVAPGDPGRAVGQSDEMGRDAKICVIAD